jgi:excisionase family DNA binding protein
MDHQDQPDQLLADGLERVRDSARFLSVSVSQVYALMQRGELPFVKIGKSRRIPRRALVEFAKRNLNPRP